MVKNHLKIIRSWSRSGSSPKLNKFVLVTHPPYPQSFIRIRAQLFWDIVLYIVYGPTSQWWRITFKILVVGSGYGSSPKSTQFVLVTHPTCPQNFSQIPQQFFEISYTQTNRQTERGENITSFTFSGRGNKHNSPRHANLFLFSNTWMGAPCTFSYFYFYRIQGS